MSTKPREPWRVILTQNGIQLVEVPHTSEAKAFAHVRAALRSGADTAKVMQWEGAAGGISRLSTLMRSPTPDGRQHGAPPR